MAIVTREVGSLHDQEGSFVSAKARRTVVLETILHKTRQKLPEGFRSVSRMTPGDEWACVRTLGADFGFLTVLRTEKCGLCTGLGASKVVALTSGLSARSWVTYSSTAALAQ